MNTTLRTALIAVAAAGIALTGGVLLASAGPGSGPAGSSDPAGAVTSLDVTTGSLATDPAGGVEGDEGAATPGDTTPAAGGAGIDGAASGGSTDPGATDEGETDEGATDEGESSGGVGAGGEPSGEPVPDGPTAPEPDHQPVDPAPVDPAPVDPAPVDPAGEPAATVPGQLYLGAAVTKALPLANSGGAPLEWSVVSDDAWLSVTSPTSGVLAPGAATSLTVRVDRRLTPQQVSFVQPYVGTLRLTTSVGAKVVTVRAIPLATAVDEACTTKLVLGAPLNQVSYRAVVTLSANDRLTVEVTGPHPKPAAPVTVVNGSATVSVLLPSGARASSKLVLRPAHGPQVILPLQEGCTPTPSPAGSLAEAGA